MFENLIMVQNKLLNASKLSCKGHVPMSLYLSLSSSQYKILIWSKLGHMHSDYKANITLISLLTSSIQQVCPKYMYEDKISLIISIMKLKHILFYNFFFHDMYYRVI